MDLGETKIACGSFSLKRVTDVSILVPDGATHAVQSKSVIAKGAAVLAQRPVFAWPWEMNS
jgi:hypothetical protein